MAVNSTHPQYDDKAGSWQVLRDCYLGEEHIKSCGFTYLPATPGQVLDGALQAASLTNVGLASYNGYRARAVFPDAVEIGVQTLIGVLNAKKAEITLPPELEYLRSKAMLTNEGLDALLRKIHEEQLVTGRAGILADLPANPSQVDPKQYIVLYKAEDIKNWDDGSFNDGFNKLNLVVLDESGYKRTSNFEWTEEEKYRVLTLGEVGPNEALGTYRTASVGVDSEGPDTYTTPTFKGVTLDEIPFVFVGAKDLDPEPDTPPLLGLARISLTIYRAEADYRQTLFMQGQDTLVVVGGVRSQSVGPDGGEAPLRVGNGARIDVELTGDVKYAGVGAEGLSEQRSAIEADRLLASVRTGQLLAPGKMSLESGEALKTRIAAQTATLTSVALAAAAALEQLLRTMAKWAGADPEKVRVSPNLDFTNVAMAGQDIVQILTAKNLGMPLSYKTIFEILRDRGLTRNSFEDEMELIKKDPPELADLAERMAGSATGNNPIEAAGGPTKKPAVAPVKSNKPKK